jgi:hypothetical protein
MVLIYFAIKSSISMGAGFFLSALTLLALQFIVLSRFVSVNESSEQIKRYKNSTVAVVISTFSILFVLTNFHLVMVAPSSAINLVGRLHGTTVNPQHIAMMLALCVPAINFQISQSKNIFTVVVFWSIILVLLVYLQFLTGSRTGAGLTMIALAYPVSSWLLTRGGFAKFLTFLLFLLIVIAVYSDTIWRIFSVRFILDREETRSENWLSVLRYFSEHLILGIPADLSTGRLLFVENYWISALANGGIILLPIIIIFAISIVMATLRCHLLWSLDFTDKRLGMYASALFIMISASMVESIFAGFFVGHTMLSICYLGGLFPTMSRNSR